MVHNARRRGRSMPRCPKSVTRSFARTSCSSTTDRNCASVRGRCANDVPFPPIASISKPCLAALQFHVQLKVPDKRLTGPGREGLGSETSCRGLIGSRDERFAIGRNDWRQDELQLLVHPQSPARSLFRARSLRLNGVGNTPGYGEIQSGRFSRVAKARGKSDRLSRRHWAWQDSDRRWRPTPAAHPCPGSP